LCGNEFKPWLEQNNFLFVKTYFGMDVKRHRNSRRPGENSGCVAVLEGSLQWLGASLRGSQCQHQEGSLAFVLSK